MRKWLNPKLEASEHFKQQGGRRRTAMDHPPENTEARQLSGGGPEERTDRGNGVAMGGINRRMMNESTGGRSSVAAHRTNRGERGPFQAFV